VREASEILEKPHKAKKSHKTPKKTRERQGKPGAAEEFACKASKLVNMDDLRYIDGDF